MNRLWKLRMKARACDTGKFHERKKFLRFFVCILIILQFMFPQYLKRVVYPYFLGKKAEELQVISQEDFFEDVGAIPFHYQRNGKDYILVPRAKYLVTGRVGIVDNYDGLWTKFYRGYVQGDYINLVPRDVVLVIGQMADPEVFNLFDFEHEERMGGAKCKGVKYRESFMSFYSSRREMEESERNLAICEPYIKAKEYNNYHPIPANETINMAMSMLLYGDVVTLEGILVDVPQMGLDTGTRKEQVHEKFRINGQKPGKCFVLYTTKVIINGFVYE